MGMVWGALSGKFAITATGLLIASRVDHARLQAAIDPRLPTTQISRDFATRAHLPGNDGAALAPGRTLFVGLGNAEFGTPSIALAGDLPRGIDLRIGADLLRQHVLMLDMPHCLASLVLPGDYSTLARRFDAVPLAVDAQGGLRLMARVGDRATEAVLDLAAVTPQPTGAAVADGSIALAIGADRLALPVAATIGGGNGPIRIGLAAFAGRRIVLDLPHGRLWIERQERAAPAAPLQTACGDDKAARHG